MLKAKQIEPGRRILLAAIFVASFMPGDLLANDRLDSGGLTFRDFGILDNGASFSRGDQIIGGGSSKEFPRIVGIDRESGAVRVRFESTKVEIALPMGWQAAEDWERGTAYSIDKRYRVLVWRVDFEYEAVKDAEHYAATKVGSIKARRPSVQGQARKLGDGTYLIVYENVPKGQGDSEIRTVFDLIIPNPGNPKFGVLLTLGVPASENAKGLKLMALLRKNLRIDW